jgi:riboflavin kinase/FMN adenylyltransferase
VVGAFEIEGNVISSSLIRRLIEGGDIISVNKYLGRNYKVRGQIIKGKSIGRELDFPTANIDIGTVNQMIPKNGVYFIKTKINEDNYCGMCNIGCKPTVSNENRVSMEVHIFNYSEFDLYAQFIEIEFVDYVRNERKFENTEELKSQLIKDKEYCEGLQF